MSHKERPRFQAGGALRPDAVYADRPADGELLRALRDGLFCHVLASRQIGKTSLRMRTTTRLRDEGITCVGVSLSELGGAATSADEWYAALVGRLVGQLGPHVEPGYEDVFWTEQRSIPPARRWATFLREVVLTRVPGSVVVFLDELEATLTLPFARDEFFAVLRALHDDRDGAPELERLSFCLLGAATARELTPDPTRAPFAVSHGVVLRDFERAELEPFEAGFAGILPDARAVLDAIYAETSGHPYMTQRVAADLVGDRRGASTAEVVQERFLLHGRAEDPELAYADRQFHRLHGDERAADMLLLYARLHAGEEIDWDPADDTQEALRLTGLAAPRYDGVVHWRLHVRNRIVAKVFDEAWIRSRDEERLFADPLARWLRSGRRDDALLRGEELRGALAWARAREDVTADERAFLKAARQAARRERLRLAGLFVFGAATAALVVAVAALFWLWQGAEADRVVARDEATTAEQAREAAAANAGRAETERVAATDRAEREKSERERAVAAAAAATAAAQRASRARDEALARSMAATSSLTRARYPERRLLLAAEGARRAAGLEGTQPAAVQEALRNATRWRHGIPWSVGPRSAVAVAPGSTRIAAADAEGAVHLWRTDGGGVPAPDGDARTGGVATAVSVAADGTTVVGREDGVVVSVRAGAGPETLGTLPGPIRAVAAANGAGRIVAIDGTGAAYEWAPGGTPAAPRSLATDAIAVTVTPDGQWVVVATRDAGTTAWYLGGPAPQTVTLRNERSRGRDPVLATDPRGAWLASGSAAGEIRLWDLSRGAKLKKPAFWMRHHRNSPAVTALSIPSDGAHVVAAYADHSARLWSLRDGRRFRVAGTLYAHDSSVIAVGALPSPRDPYAPVSDDEPSLPRVITIAASGPARLWRPGEPPRFVDPIVVEGHARSVDALAVSPDSRWFATGDARGRLRVWPLTPDGAADDPVASFRAHRAGITGLAFRPDGAIISAGGDRRVHVWPSVAELLALPIDPEDGDRTDPEPRLTLDAGGRVASLALAPDGLHVAVGVGESAPGLWKLGPGGHDAVALTLAPFPDTTGGSGRALAFAADGARLAAGVTGPAGVGLWTLTGTARNPLPRRLDGRAGTVRSLGFLPDGRNLAAGHADGRVRLWPATSTAPAGPDAAPSTLRGGLDGPVRVVAVHPKGHWLAAGGDGLLLWDLRAEAAAPIHLRSHSGAIRAATFSPDGAWLLTGAADATARLWRTSVDELRALACQAAGRDLTKDEWRDVAGDAEWQPTCPKSPAP